MKLLVLDNEFGIARLDVTERSGGKHRRHDRDGRPNAAPSRTASDLIDRSMKLLMLDDELGIARLDATDPTPAWAEGKLSSVTRAAEELSIVCAAAAIPADVQAARGWRCLRVAGRLDFSLTGVLAAIAGPLAAAHVSIFAVSTYDTDYVLVPGESLRAAMEALSASGHEVVSERDRRNS